jgi:hypothetical protein
MSYPALDIRLKNGKDLLLPEAVEAIESAMRIIETIGTTGAETTKTIRRADDWLKKYYPERV